MRLLATRYVIWPDNASEFWGMEALDGKVFNPMAEHATLLSGGASFSDIVKASSSF